MANAEQTGDKPLVYIHLHITERCTHCLAGTVPHFGLPCTYYTKKSGCLNMGIRFFIVGYRLVMLGITFVLCELWVTLYLVQRYWPEQVGSLDLGARCIGSANEFHVCYLARDRKSTRLNSSHANISYAVFCLKKKI